MSYPSSYSYVSPTAPSSTRPPHIGFKTTLDNPISNMSGYPSYPNQGAPSYPNYPGYPPTGGPPYQQAPGQYPGASNPSYPASSSPAYPMASNSAYPSAPGGGVPYPSSAYSTPGMGYPQPAASYPQPGFNQPGAGYPSAGYPPVSQSAYPPMQPSYAPQPTGPQMTSYPGAPGIGQPQAYGQPQVQAYGQPYSAPAQHPTGPSAYYPGGVSSNPPYGSSTASGYNITYGTIVPYSPFDPKGDAQILRKAMKGLGTDEKAIIRVLCNRTNAQRLQIATEYKTLFGKDLVSNLKSELSGNFEDVICALMLPRALYLAKCMNRAISGVGTNELTLIEILCTSTNAEIREINAVYKMEYKRLLENDIIGDTSGYFKRLLVSLNVGNRDENPTVNQVQAAQDAQRLYQAGEGRWGTEESVFNSILVSRSFAQLRVIFQEYERTSHRTIEATLQNEMSGDLLQGMVAVVKCVRNRCAYFAERLRNSLKGAGTVDNTLIRIIVSRSEIDLKTIRDEYQRMFGRSLVQDISDDTSGDYKRVLLDIIQ